MQILKKTAVLIGFVLITSIIREVLNVMLGVEISGPFTSRIISQIFTLLTGAGILILVELL